MFYDSTKIEGRPFSKDVAIASLASLVVHLAAAMACFFGFTQVPPLELPQVLTVSLVSALVPPQGVKSVWAVETGAQVSPGRRAEDEREAETQLPVTAVRVGRESPEKSEQPPAARPESSSAAFIPPPLDDNLPGLSIVQTASPPAGTRIERGLSVQTGDGQANPPVKVATFGSAGEIAAGGGAPFPGSAKTESARVASAFAAPRYGENVPPVYPFSARLRGQAGVVMLSVEVLADGSVGRLEIKKSSGYELLDKSALEAVRNWKFSPARKAGIPVIMWVDVPVRFALN